MIEYIEILRLLTRGGWILMIFSVGLVVHELSSINVRQRVRRLHSLLLFVISLVALLITFDFFLETVLVRVISVTLNVVFLYGLSFYLLSFRHKLRKKVDLDELEQTRRQLEILVEQMKKPLVK